MIPARYASRVSTEDSQGGPSDPAPGDELDFPIAGEDPEPDTQDGAEPTEERELTAMEMMGAPNRPSDSAQKTVLWISLIFISLIFAMTLAVIGFYGLDILTLSTLVILGFIEVVLIGAVRYKGEDPMAKFDPPPRPKKRLFRRGTK